MFWSVLTRVMLLLPYAAFFRGKVICCQICQWVRELWTALADRRHVSGQLFDTLIERTTDVWLKSELQGTPENLMKTSADLGSVSNQCQPHRILKSCPVLCCADVLVYCSLLKYRLVDVLLCWCVDVNMYCCNNVVMRWCNDVLMCGLIDTLFH